MGRAFTVVGIPGVRAAPDRNQPNRGQVGCGEAGQAGVSEPRGEARLRWGVPAVARESCVRPGVHRDAEQALLYPWRVCLVLAGLPLRGEAGVAVDGPVAAGLERHLGFLSALRAGGGEHRPV